MVIFDRIGMYKEAEYHHIHNNVMDLIQVQEKLTTHSVENFRIFLSFRFYVKST